MNEKEKIFSLYKKLIRSPKYTFPQTGKISISTKQGIYVIYNSRNQVLHVGNTPRGKNGLNQRLYNHISRASSFSRLYLKPNNLSLRGVCTFQIIEVSDARKRALLEALAVGLLCPAHIGTGEKKLNKSS